MAKPKPFRLLHIFRRCHFANKAIKQKRYFHLLGSLQMAWQFGIASFSAVSVWEIFRFVPDSLTASCFLPTESRNEKVVGQRLQRKKYDSSFSLGKSQVSRITSFIFTVITFKTQKRGETVLGLAPAPRKKRLGVMSIFISSHSPTAGPITL